MRMLSAGLTFVTGSQYCIKSCAHPSPPSLQAPSSPAMLAVCTTARGAVAVMQLRSAARQQLLLHAPLPTQLSASSAARPVIPWDAGPAASGEWDIAESRASQHRLSLLRQCRSWLVPFGQQGVQTALCRLPAVMHAEQCHTWHLTIWPSRRTSLLPLALLLRFLLQPSRPVATSALQTSSLPPLESPMAARRQAAAALRVPAAATGVVAG